jgi:hypothetical protein
MSFINLTLWPLLLAILIQYGAERPSAVLGTAVVTEKTSNFIIGN